MRVTAAQMQAELRRRRVALYGDHPDEVLDRMAAEEMDRRFREDWAQHEQAQKEQASEVAE